MTIDDHDHDHERDHERGNAADGHTFDHLLAMSDQRGLFEHAKGTEPRVEHGYCTDDNARMLVVTSRVPDVGAAHQLSRLALHFTRAAQANDGRCRNRMDAAGRWTDEPGTEDCWGRSIWGFGVAAAQHRNPAVRRWAQQSFDKGVQQRSPWPRSMVFAALGAAEVAAIDPQHTPARALLNDLLGMIGPLLRDDWVWPEQQLAYGNASVAEAVMAAGAALGRPLDVDRGLRMLSWLLASETRDGHLSVTGVGGRRADEHGPQFDQQPIEVAAMADACWRAHLITGDPSWIGGVETAAAWFRGHNDAGLMMIDERSHGSYDGLHPHSVNLNQGAESTLALISTMQRTDALVGSR
ncbi:MAG: hypothetical protein KAY11_00915 [Ilumatobacteraceae bacterium]|jgi:hypothetical protein|nr:hypothetical protein [Ilumatobacteraceae bacterium]MBP7887938.1 hypothetical protein [Ilumatobacteraceae bacterium]MBP8208094.1 hypothetical protein [Ilumatobacteraceae bacterium]